jgi:anaphase-promoting complex subunit 5
MHLLPPTPNPTTDPELHFQLSLLQIDYHQRVGAFEAAYNAIEDLSEELSEEDADVYQRIHVMVLKALLYAKVGKPQKGFSVAIRAANAAWQAKILPALWESWGAVANILGSLEEYEAESRLLEGIIPQVNIIQIRFIASTLTAMLGSRLR